ncbi:MAG: hypothetical protein WCG06_05935, partial [Candidatus Omnitrophota bacterium]
MKFGEKLRDWLERICIRHLTVMLIAGSATSYVYSVFDRRFVGMLALVPAAAWTGEYWRFVSFVFCPLEMHPIFAFFVYYFFFLMGTTLEADWGPARFTRYIATAVAVTVGLSFFYPIGVYTNEFIFTSIFLAFAVLYPDFLVYVFFILPVKMKYLAGFTWVCYGLTLVYGGWPAKIGVAAVTVNFLIFFGPE